MYIALLGLNVRATITHSDWLATGIIMTMYVVTDSVNPLSVSFRVLFLFPIPGFITCRGQLHALDGILHIDVTSDNPLSGGVVV